MRYFQRINNKLKWLTLLVIMHLFVSFFLTIDIKKEFGLPLSYFKEINSFGEVFFIIVLLFWMILLTQELNIYFKNRKFTKYVYILIVPELIFVILSTFFMNIDSFWISIGTILIILDPIIYLYVLIILLKSLRKIFIFEKNSKIKIFILGIMIQIIGNIVAQITFYVVAYNAGSGKLTSLSFLENSQWFSFLCLVTFYATMIIGIKKIMEINGNKYNSDNSW